MQLVPDEHIAVPLDIHPAGDHPRIDTIELLRTPPNPGEDEDEWDYYTRWWEALVKSAAKKS
jgi:hypothetical protein